MGTGHYGAHGPLVTLHAEKGTNFGAVGAVLPRPLEQPSALAPGQGEKTGFATRSRSRASRKQVFSVV